MRIDVAWWDLDGSSQTIDSLRRHLQSGAVEPWSKVPGLRWKCWVADRDRNLWGALMVWEVDRPVDVPLPTNHAAELIGGPPHHRLRFEVEATVEGAYALADLDRLGPVFGP